jgi:hypothetical protein
MNLTYTREVNGVETLEHPDTNSTLSGIAASLILSKSHVTMELIRRYGVSGLDRILEIAEKTMQHCVIGQSMKIYMDKLEELQGLNVTISEFHSSGSVSGTGILEMVGIGWPRGWRRTIMWSSIWADRKFRHGFGTRRRRTRKRC